jgi:hypothetical protein
MQFKSYFLNSDNKKYFAEWFLLWLLVIQCSNSNAQYTGGSNSGFATSPFFCQSLMNICVGGSYNGFSFNTNSSCTSFSNVYTGGVHDGAGFDKVICSAAVFSGGSSDGFSYCNLACIAIFNGGSSGGFASNSTTCSALPSVFAGGSYDGFDLASIGSCVSENIFSGGSAGGFSLVSIACVLPQNIFTGSSYQGFAIGTIVCSSPATIFTGGFYQGFSNLETSCTAPADIYQGGSYNGFAIENIACTPTIFSGGLKNGFASSNMACSGIFSGGFRNGFALANSSCPVAENVYKGGSSDGFVLNMISCSASANLFSGSSNDGFSFARIACPVTGTISLPVELVFLNARCDNQKVQVTWKTASEINNHYFTVERSSDGINFESRGNVDGGGTVSQPLNYTYIDPDPLPETSYYRLTQTNFDGENVTSGLTSCTCKKNPETFSIYPNPSGGRFFIEGAALGADLIITNLMTEKIYDSTIRNKKEEIILDNQPNGIYFIHVIIHREMITKKIFINQ